MLLHTTIIYSVEHLTVKIASDCTNLTLEHQVIINRIPDVDWANGPLDLEVLGIAIETNDLSGPCANLLVHLTEQWTLYS